jgi:uncharacterized repeat protein (TIGR03843 family)
MMQETHSNDFIRQSLIAGELRIAGRFLWGSNYTFLAEVQTNEETLAAVYKPSRGERPLWDFSQGTLAAREVAAYITSLNLGWELVPPTVLRPEGPAGPGSLQLYVDTNVDHHYFSFNEEEKERLRPIAVFDLVINNADRKGGHIIIGKDGHVWSIDHGVCFHIEDKLRTVIWDFATEPIPQSLITDLEVFHNRLVTDGSLRDEFLELISTSELNALQVRVSEILSNPIFPQPSTQWSYPWPLV